MPERRRDPRSGHWTWIATERARRPHDFRGRDGGGSKAACPFCAGNERLTTPEVAVRRAHGVPNGPGWSIRVVTNLYPAVAPRADEVPVAPAPLLRRDGYGHHEVLIETVHHDAHPADYEPAHVAELLAVCQERVRVLAGDPRVRLVICFQNHGFLSGASLRHPHQQIVALPESLTHQPSSADPDDSPALADRVVIRTRCLIAFVPFAPRFVGELHIAPLGVAPAFVDLDAKWRRELAEVRQDCLRRIRTAYRSPDTNLVLIAHDADAPRRRWRLEILPRMAMLGGFELATGAFINSATPEQVAASLREA